MNIIEDNSTDAKLSEYFIPSFGIDVRLIIEKW